jgi:hypothetical protein
LVSGCRWLADADAVTIALRRTLPGGVLIVTVGVQADGFGEFVGGHALVGGGTAPLVKSDAFGE